MLLESINSPADVRALPDEKLPQLCQELREFLVKNVCETGGHLASNLGAVELTVAIHRVFDTTEDRLVFDVGHQCYVHKALTGRRELFSTLRQFGGLSGFPKADTTHLLPAMPLTRFPLPLEWQGQELYKMEITIS
jgi:1-deoxy-D-xylulose-5-phosphate synthase